MVTLLADPPAEAPSRPLLRVLACGSVDDGKSTLLGRLIHDAAGLYADQAPVDDDWAGLFDGLEAEREQGITIDVAYRYFASARRHFIVVDTPGHEQYTRNMVTGASNADLAVVLVDATLGVTRQTRRHSRIVRLLGLGRVVLAVNKMDLVGFAQDRFAAIVADYAAFAASIGLAFDAVPLAAKPGDNVVEPSARMDWYDGPALLERLETADVRRPQDAAFALAVQAVTRVGARQRWLAGTVATGAARAGDEVRLLPSGQRATIAAFLDGDAGAAGQALSLRLADEVDCARGEVLAAAGSAVVTSSRVVADLVWFGERPLANGARLLAKLGHRTVGAHVASVRDVFDADSGAHGQPRTVAANDIATAVVAFETPLALTPFAASTALGGFILIDPQTQATVAAGLVREAAPETQAVAAAYRIVAAAEDLGTAAHDLHAQLDALGRRPVAIDDAVLADLRLPPGDEAALAALIRLVETTGAVPVLALAAPPALGAPFYPGDRLLTEPDWVI